MKNSIQQQVRNIINQVRDTPNQTYTTYTDKRKRGYRIKVVTPRMSDSVDDLNVITQLETIPGVKKAKYQDGWYGSSGYVVFTDLKPSHITNDPLRNATARVYNIILDAYGVGSLDEIISRYFGK